MTFSKKDAFPGEMWHGRFSSGVQRTPQIDYILDTWRIVVSRSVHLAWRNRGSTPIISVWIQRLTEKARAQRLRKIVLASIGFNTSALTCFFLKISFPCHIVFAEPMSTYIYTHICIDMGMCQYQIAQELGCSSHPNMKSAGWCFAPMVFLAKWVKI